MSRNLEIIAFLFSSSRRLLATALLASVASGFGGTWLVALINEALSADAAALPVLGCKFAGLSIVVLGLRWASETQFISLSQSTLARLRSLLSHRISAAPYRRIEAEGPGRFQAVLTEDVATVSLFFTTLPDLLMHGAVVVGCLLYLGSLSWQVLSFALAMVLLGSFGYHRAHGRALEYLRRARALEDELFRHFRALLDGAKELKLHRARRNAFHSELLDPCIARVREQRVRGLKVSVASTSFGSFLFFVLIGTVLFVLGPWLHAGGRVVSGYALMFLYMILPFEAVLGAVPNVHRARVALERIQALTGDFSASEHATFGEPLPRFEKVQLRGVTHGYRRENEDGAFVLGPIDLELSAGELVFLIGGNGSGKTTLAKLLVGLYPPDAGAVSVNGLPVTDETRERYRQHFSAVFSDFFLFERLLGADPAALDDRARELLNELDLAHKLTVSAGVFSTTELSQGQRKRLALLSAYLEERPVLLFDEWAADQDPAYKEVFYRKLLPELRARGKAVLVITHDDRYFDVADRVVKLESGKLVPSAGAEEVARVQGWSVASAIRAPDEPSPAESRKTRRKNDSSSELSDSSPTTSN